MAVIFWAFATVAALVLLAVCAASWYIALHNQREGIPASRYWREPPRNQDLS